MRGRKNIPDDIKVIKGTFRKDRSNPDAPKQAPDSMRAPSWLPRDAVEHFGMLRARIETLGMDSSSYTETLALAALRLAEIAAYTETIKEQGPSYETETNQGGRIVRPHPAVSQRSEALRHLQSLLAEFGLTPASIGKVTASDSQGKQNKFGAKFG